MGVITMKILKAIPILLIPMLMLTGIAPISVAYASKPMTGSGTYTAADGVLYDFKFNGGNTYFKFDETFTFTGTLDGIITVSGGECTTHSTGKGTCLAYGTFDGTVGGRTGTVYLLMPFTFNPDGTLQGMATSISGTGELANLHYRASFEGILGTSGTYTTQYHFDP
jgi:hypothetical protein